MQAQQRRYLICLATVFILVAALAQPLTVRAGAAHVYGLYVRPQFYLAVGDSISYGYQQRIVDDWKARTGGPPPATAFDPNAVSLFGGLLRMLNPRLQTATYACVDATTDQIINRPGCPDQFPAPHDLYSST
jgi:hypothetical protein